MLGVDGDCVSGKIRWQSRFADEKKPEANYGAGNLMNTPDAF